MLSNEADRLRRWQLLQLRTQASHDELQQQDEDDQTGDPEKPDGSLVAESVMKSVAEVGEVESGKNRQYCSFDVVIMATVDDEYGRVIKYEPSLNIAIFVIVIVAFVNRRHNRNYLLYIDTETAVTNWLLSSTTIVNYVWPTFCRLLLGIVYSHNPRHSLLP